jgi:hypothetical protein
MNWMTKPVAFQSPSLQTGVFIHLTRTLTKAQNIWVATCSRCACSTCSSFQKNRRFIACVTLQYNFFVIACVALQYNFFPPSPSPLSTSHTNTSRARQRLKTLRELERGLVCLAARFGRLLSFRKGYSENVMSWNILGVVHGIYYLQSKDLNF